MIFTMSTAVCAVEDIYSTENQNGYGMGLGDEVYTIDDSQSSNYGITADVTRKNLLSLETSKLSEKPNFVGFKDDAIVEVYDIKVKYSTTENGSEVIKTTDDYSICDSMIVSIPCDNPNLYVLDVSEGTTSSYTSFEYLNGKYYFQTSSPGSFMLCSNPAPEPEAGQKFNMIQQTLVDSNTGIIVSGMIPEGAMMYTQFENIPDTYPSGIGKSEYGDYLLKDDYPLPSLREVFTKKTTDGKTKYDYSWYEEDFTASGSMVVDIVFIKEYEIIEFDSDLTVTLPLDYYKVLESENFEFVEDFESDFSDEYVAELKEKISRSNIAEVFQLDSRTSNLEEVEVLTKTGGADEFEFKTSAKGTGTFFVGNELLIGKLVENYGWTYEDLSTSDKTTATTATTTATTTTTVPVSADVTETVAEKNPDSNKALSIIFIAIIAILAVVPTVFIVKNKKKKQ